jgi:hypothetical protein
MKLTTKFIERNCKQNSNEIEHKIQTKLETKLITKLNKIIKNKIHQTKLKIKFIK